MDRSRRDESPELAPDLHAPRLRFKGRGDGTTRQGSTFTSCPQRPNPRNGRCRGHMLREPDARWART
jgi:hypothetical protein